MAPQPLTIQERSPAHWVLRAVAVGVVVLLLWYPPNNFEIFRLNQVTDALTISLAALALNLLVGFTGQISLGHSAFFGIGAYTTAILVVDHGWSAGWTFYAGAAVAFVVGVVIGIPALRLKGIYLALVTLAIAVLFPALARKFDSITGGSEGIKGVRYRPPDWTGLKGRQGDAQFKYWLMILLLAVGYVVARNLVKSRVGRAMVATRDNEVAAQVMGVNLALIKTITFGISAGICALAGSMSAIRTTVVSPDNLLYTLLGSIIFLVAMIIGGTATLIGPIVGGLAYYFIDYLARDWADGPIASVVFGALLIALMFVAPQGIVGFFKRLARAVVRVVPRPPAPLPGGPPPELVAEPAVVGAPSGTLAPPEAPAT